MALRLIKTKYYLDEWIGDRKQKTRHRIYLGVDNSQPALALLRYHQEKERLWRAFYGFVPESPGPMPTPLSNDQLIDQFLTETAHKKKKTPSTLSQEQCCLRKINGYLAGISWLRLKPDHFAFLDKQLKSHGASPQTINNYIRIFSVILNWMVANRFMPTNPARGIKPYTIDRNIETYTASDLDKIFSVAADLKSRPSLYCRYFKECLQVCYLTGMRIGEVINLKWTDLKNNTIAIKATQTKGKRAREIPISRQLQSTLDSLPHDSEYVIPLPWGRTQAGFTLPVRLLRQQSGFPSFHIHNLRHTIATNLLQHGIDIKTVQEILGHVQMATTERYLHTSLTRKRQALESI